jgi:hypothetical protein
MLVQMRENNVAPQMNLHSRVILKKVQIMLGKKLKLLFFMYINFILSNNATLSIWESQEKDIICFPIEEISVLLYYLCSIHFTYLLHCFGYQLSDTLQKKNMAQVILRKSASSNLSFM